MKASERPGPSLFPHIILAAVLNSTAEATAAGFGRQVEKHLLSPMRSISALLLFTCISSASAQWTWVPRAGLGSSGETRWGTCEFVIDGIAYVVGGRVISTDVNEVWAYDPVADAWEPKAPIPGVRRLAAAFAINGKGYVTCGLYENSSMRNDLLEYDPVADSWTQKASLPDDERYSSAAFTVGGKGYIVGGNQGGANGPYSTDCWAYDPMTDAWSARAPLPGQTLFAARGFAADGKGHVVGGRLSDQTFTNALWQYDPGTDAWTAKAALPGIPRTYSFAWSLDYHGLIMAGDNLQGQQLNDLWRYLPSNDSWTSFTPYTGGGNWGGAAFAIDGRVYAGLGRQGTGAVNDLMELRDAFTDVREAMPGKVFQLSPNPCTAGGSLQLHLRTASASEPLQLVVADLAGQEVARVQFSAGAPTIIQVPDLANGIYSVSLMTRDQRVEVDLLMVQ